MGGGATDIRADGIDVIGGRAPWGCDPVCTVGIRVEHGQIVAQNVLHFEDGYCGRTAVTLPRYNVGA